MDIIQRILNNYVTWPMHGCPGTQDYQIILRTYHYSNFTARQLYVMAVSSSFGQIWGTFDQLFSPLIEMLMMTLINHRPRQLLFPDTYFNYILLHFHQP